LTESQDIAGKGTQVGAAAEVLAKRFWSLRVVGEGLRHWDALSDEERGLACRRAERFITDKLLPHLTTDLESTQQGDGDHHA
jgi:hypothetical protein